MLVKVPLIVCLLFTIVQRGGCNPCLQDWELFGESCYGFGESLVTWGDAQEFCRMLGAKLAEIETSAENDFLKGQAHNKGGVEYWIGGSDVFHEGSWMWMSTGQLISFTDWYGNEPNDVGDHEDCLVLKQSDSYQWNDWPCNRNFNFICEKPAGEIVVG